MSSTMYTENFQKQLLYVLCTDKEYMKNYGDVISVDYFESNECKIIFKLIRDYVGVYDTELMLDTLITQIHDYCERNNVDESFYKIYKALAGSIFESGDSLETSDYIKDYTTSFIQRQEVKKALLKSIDILTSDGDYQQIPLLLEEAVAIGDTQDEGLCIEDLGNLKQLYRDAYSKNALISTGFPNYDKALLGGMGPGEVHCVCAAPKGGKTTFGCNIGAYNVAHKKNVFHFTLEIKAVDLMVKYALILGQVSYPEFFSLTDDEYKYKLRKFTTARDNLFIKYYVGSTVNCGHIRSYISKVCSKRRAIDKDFKPHLIIIDYDDYLLPIKTGDNSDYNNAGYVYDDMIILANYFKCPVLTFSQTVRGSWDSYEKENILITAADVAHSAKRVHKCYSFSSLNFKYKSDFGVLYVDRNRKGPGNQMISLKRDLSRAYFSQDMEAHDTPVGDAGGTTSGSEDIHPL